MGGDKSSPRGYFLEDESSLDNDYPEISAFSGGGSRMKVEEDDSLKEPNWLDFIVADEMDLRSSCNTTEFDSNLRRRNAYKEILWSYDGLWARNDRLPEARSKILSYSPGSWVEKVDGMKLSDYIIPKTTTLLLIGPRGSGKSSLVNRISRVFEDDKFAPERAQVSYNYSSAEDGTYFIQEYMIPRGSTSFCLVDTRSLSDDFSENDKMLQSWMTKGVRHGELVSRTTDSSLLKTRLKCRSSLRARGYHERRKVDFIIFVVNGTSVLRSMNTEGDENTLYAQMLAKNFKCPYLSFQDDKPVVVVTHGDLVSIQDQARVRVYLGELLGVSPTKQIFDIPDNCEPSTDLAIVDMIRYSLEHADRNHLPRKGWLDGSLFLKIWGRLKALRWVFLVLLLVILISSTPADHRHHRHIWPPRREFYMGWLADRPHENGETVSKSTIDWPSIRHLWLDTD